MKRSEAIKLGKYLHKRRKSIKDQTVNEVAADISNDINDCLIPFLEKEPTYSEVKGVLEDFEIPFQIARRVKKSENKLAGLVLDLAEALLKEEREIGIHKVGEVVSQLKEYIQK